MLEEQIKTQLSAYIDPYLNKDLISAKAVKSITIDQGQVNLQLALGYPCAKQQPRLLADLQLLLEPLLQGKSLNIALQQTIAPHVAKAGLKPLPSIKNIIAIASGKGGVGKSTLALQLALSLQAEGAIVGLLDADIYGPSQPTMLGTQGVKPQVAEGRFYPIEKWGLQTLSIGNLIAPNAAMVWRGPMIGKAMEQMLYDTNWHDLDYLIIDLPPGTGDIQLTLAQKAPLSGVVMVTTPQKIALIDVERACEMFVKLQIPLLGIIENMSYYHCPHCEHDDPLFGSGGGLQLSETYHVPLLGTLPLNVAIREAGDQGEASHHSVREKVAELALRMAGQLANQKISYTGKFPPIVVQQK